MFGYKTIASFENIVLFHRIGLLGHFGKVVEGN